MDKRSKGEPDGKVHFYAGWPGKVVCIDGHPPIGTCSTIKSEHVTCEECRRLLTPPQNNDVKP